MYANVSNQFNNVKLDVVEDEFISTNHDRTFSCDTIDSNIITQSEKTGYTYHKETTS